MLSGIAQKFTTREMKYAHESARRSEQIYSHMRARPSDGRQVFKRVRISDKSLFRRAVSGFSVHRIFGNETLLPHHLRLRTAGMKSRYSVSRPKPFQEVRFKIHDKSIRHLGPSARVIFASKPQNNSEALLTQKKVVRVLPF